MKKLSNLSYEEYMKDQLMLISNCFTVKAYKRANLDDWAGFEKGRDIRIQIQWKKEPIYEFIAEKSFWYMRNTNKEDRNHMRNWADPKINMFKNAITKKKPTKVISNNKTESPGFTQTQFENMKKA
tara:strand:- start:69 stop:446 length:378 start_codon:yes stop_codon:yes gene_type:complete